MTISKQIYSFSFIALISFTSFRGFTQQPVNIQKTPHGGASKLRLSKIHLAIDQMKSSTDAEPIKSMPFPEAVEITNSIAEDRKALSASTLIDERNGWLSKLNSFVDNLTYERSMVKPACNLRALVLFYPNTDTDYMVAGNEVKHFSGSLPNQRVRDIESIFSKLSSFILDASGGMCAITTDVRTIKRFVNFGGIEERADHTKTRIGFQHPVFTAECLPEKQQFFDIDPYDIVIVLYNEGPIPQDLAGAGGLGPGYFIQHFNVGHNGWNVNDPARSLGGIIHELIHGLDGLYAQRGYRTIRLHHLYALATSGLSYDWNLHKLLMQGRAYGLNDKRYGYGRPAWLTGSPRAKLSLPLPIQLQAPVPGASTNVMRPIRFEWCPIKARSANTSYRLVIYKAGQFDKPFLVRNSKQTAVRLALSELPVGRYIWTVQAIAGTNISPIGESFRLSIVPSASEIKLKLFPVPEAEPELKSGEIQHTFRAIASSSMGLESVCARVTYTDGRQQVFPLHRRSPVEVDNNWLAKIAFWDVMKKESLKVEFTAIDFAGVMKSISAASVTINPAERPWDTVTQRLECRLFNQMDLPEGQNTHDMPSANFLPATSLGGSYPVYVLFDNLPRGIKLNAVWCEVTDETGQTNRYGLEYYANFNAMWYCLAAIPENKDVRDKSYQVVFKVRLSSKNGSFGDTTYISTPFEMKQEAAQE